jgi:branched-chain amino acid transport system substrate-binding protein
MYSLYRPNSWKRKKMEQKQLYGLFVILLVIVGVGGFYVGTLMVPAPTEEEPLTIGCSLALTGGYAGGASYIKEGYLMWQRDINLRGGLLGRPVQFVILDDESDPATSALLYEKLITEDQVDMVTGPFSSACTFAMATTVEKYNMPCLTPGSIALSIYTRGYKNVFMFFTPEAGEKYPLIQTMLDNNLESIAIINEDSSYPKDSGNATEYLCEDAGIDVLWHDEYPTGVTDLSGLILQIKEANADCVLQVGYFPDGYLFVNQAKEAGLEPKMFCVVISGQSPEFYDTLGDDSNYITATVQWVDNPKLPYPGIDTFISDYIEMWSRRPDQRSAIAYGAMQVLEHVVTEVGSLDYDAIRTGYSELEMDTVFGAYAVDSRGVQTAHESLLIQWQDGEQVIIFPESLETGTAEVPFPGWD